MKKKPTRSKPRSTGQTVAVISGGSLGLEQGLTAGRLLALLGLVGLGLACTWGFTAADSFTSVLGKFWSKPLVEMGGNLEALTRVPEAKIIGLYLQLLALALAGFWMWSRRPELGAPSRPARVLAWAALVLEFVAVAALLHFLLGYLLIMAQRIRYPFELEWGEGAHMDVVKHILAGKPLYPEPSLDYIPMIYTPLFLYAGAAAVSLLGESLFSLRLVSLFAFVAILFMLFSWVRRETGRLLPALASIGFFAATFELSGAWFELVRVDTFFVAMVMAGAYTLRFAEGRRGYLLAAFWMLAATATKQTGAALMAGLGVMAVLKDWRLGLLYCAVGAGTALGVYGLAALWTQGWSHFYLIELGFHIPINKPAIKEFWVQGLLQPCWPAVVIALAGLAALWVRPQDRQRGRFHLLLFAFVFYITYKGRILQGAYINHMMLLHAFMAILIGLGVGLLPQVLPKRAVLALVCHLAVAALLVAQAGKLRYDPDRYIPQRSDSLSWERMVETLKKVPGDVLMPFHGWIPSLAGKKPHAYVMNLDAILMQLPPTDPIWKKLMTEIERRLGEKEFGAVIIDAYGWMVVNNVLTTTYDHKYFEFGGRPPVAGWGITPNAWYSPKPDKATGKGN